jgi:hypothetical protein
MTPMMVAIGGRSGVPASHLQQLDLQARNHQPAFLAAVKLCPSGLGGNFALAGLAERALRRCG